MKNLIIFIFTLLISSASFAQIDRSKAPAPGPAPKTQLGNYETFTLDNGLQVFLVENHKTPRVSWQLFVDRGVVSEGENTGMHSLMGSLLMTGTSSKNKAEIDESIDFIGASMSTSSYGAYASSLSKHKETTLELMSDVILHPSFPEEELNKLKKQTLSGLMANASDPGAMSENVSAVVTYGKEHPYGEVETEASVESITAEMCQAFYSTYFKPNASYLIIVGDISKKEAQPLVEKYFNGWAKGEIPKHNFAMPTAPEKTEVDFVNKPGAVQSTISIVYPVDLKPGSDDAIAASVMNAILGNSGFMARLIQNIREDKAYTYGAYSSLASDPLVGDFYAGAEVRNEVTDSAVVQFLYEMERLTKERVNDEELQNVKNYLNGRFARSLERPQTVARFALNTARYDLPTDYYATYLERLQAVSADDIQRVAKKYLLPQQSHIVVVGNKAEVASKLKVFAANGKINYYDAFGNPVADAEPIPEGVTAETVINKYLDAIGKREDLEKVNSQDITMSSSMQGMPLTIHYMTKGNTKMLMSVKSGDLEIQTIKINENTGKISGMMGAKDLTEDEIKSYLEGNAPFEELTFMNKTAKLIQIEEINGVKAYKMEVIDQDGHSKFYFYDVNTGLKIAMMESKPTPQGDMTTSTFLKDYQSVNGILVPFTTVEDNAGQVMEMKVENIVLGGSISDTNFQVK
ncbi:insulinase family protein [bacterium SCSIO 12643]|nr:insulinase family protein [bacterium SCSIO 12643]